MYVLVWCIICTGLGVLNWTGVMYVLDWGLLIKNYTKVISADLISAVTLVEHGFIPKHPPYSRASRPSIMVAHVFQIVQGVRFSTQ